MYSKIIQNFCYKDSYDSNKGNLFVFLKIVLIFYLQFSLKI